MAEFDPVDRICIVVFISLIVSLSLHKLSRQFAVPIMLIRILDLCCPRLEFTLIDTP